MDEAMLSLNTMIEDGSVEEVLPYSLQCCSPFFFSTCIAMASKMFQD
jgi:hypothetical protein